MRLPGFTHSQLPDWYYISGLRVTCNGEQTVALPSTATCIYIRANGGDVYYDLNETTANTTSPGYVPEDALEVIGPMSNLDALTVYGSGATVYAHIEFWREA